MGDTGSQRVETNPSAVHAGSRGARTARASHSLTRPWSPLSPPSIRAMSVHTRACGRSSVSGCRASRASLQSRASIAATATATRPSSLSGVDCASVLTRFSRSRGESPIRRNA